MVSNSNCDDRYCPMANKRLCAGREGGREEGEINYGSKKRSKKERKGETVEGVKDKEAA